MKDHQIIIIAAHDLDTTVANYIAEKLDKTVIVVDDISSRKISDPPILPKLKCINYDSIGGYHHKSARNIRREEQRKKKR